MTLSLSFSAKSTSKADTVVLFTDAKGQWRDEAGKALDKKSGGLLGNALKSRESFSGKAGETVAVFLPKECGYAQALIVGLGDAKNADSLAYENTGGKVYAALRAIGAQKVEAILNHGSAEELAAFANGLTLRSYDFDKYKASARTSGKSKAKTKTKGPSQITLIGDKASAATKLYATHKAVAQGVFLARDLVNEPANVLYPESYAAIIAKELKPLGVQVEILDEKKMQKLGFGAHLAVGMGSIRPPRVVIMRWNGTSKAPAKGGKAASSAKAKPPIAFVGKGVTFDTGGISIKPAAGMEEMKMDMGGSAAVVGLIKALALSKAKTDVVGVVGLAENMPSDRSYRPGDIVTSLSGKTIEVLNTDAEGRLVLCDALTYVQRTYKPSAIVDLATLTGAIMVALGYEYAGTFANDDKLWSGLEKASAATGEKLWRMPLDEAYRDEMKSRTADLQNLGSVGRWGGACSAAGFLQHFIEDDKTAWAHIDIAGTAWWKTDKPTVPKGATGFGVRLLHKLVTETYGA